MKLFCVLVCSFIRKWTHLTHANNLLEFINPANFVPVRCKTDQMIGVCQILRLVAVVVCILSWLLSRVKCFIPFLLRCLICCSVISWEKQRYTSNVCIRVGGGNLCYFLWSKLNCTKIKWMRTKVLEDERKSYPSRHSSKREQFPLLRVTKAEDLNISSTFWIQSCEILAVFINLWWKAI